MMEDKLISDILVYLDGWKVEDKPPHTRHKPQNPKYLDAFNETSEDIEDSNYRKTVTKKEILQTYDIAKIHVLNYIKRPVFPRTPVTHVAICMWTAGLLSQKARFRKQRIENSYNLIKEAKKLLQPHVKHDIKISTISGPHRPPECDIENYRLPNHHNHNCPPKKDDCACNKDHMYNGPRKHHKPCPPQFEYDEPEWEDFFLKKNHITFKLLPVKGSVEEDVVIKALVRDVYGNRVDDGIVKFYIEDEDDF